MFYKLVDWLQTKLDKEYAERKRNKAAYLKELQALSDRYFAGKLSQDDFERAKKQLAGKYLEG